MSELLFYENIVALNRERHRNLKLDRSKADASFATQTHYVPIAGVEFEYAARSYPILFAGAGEESGPITLLGLTPGRNPFVTADRTWRSGAYVPAFVRRYPLVLAQGEGDEYTVCIDEAYSCLSEDHGEPLFDPDGNDSALLRDSVAFLDRFRADMERTMAFQARLEELGLLRRNDLQVTHPDGRIFTLKDFRFVDVERLDDLQDEELRSLQRDGYLAWIYAHRISLTNLPHLEPAPEDAGDITDPTDAPESASTESVAEADAG